MLLRLLQSLLPAGFAALALGLTGCGKPATPPAAGEGQVKLRFQTDWFPQPEHGGYYQAQARGFYAAEGLDVEILPGGPNAQVLSRTATGRVELAMTNGDDVIVAIARGLPLRIVAAEMQRDAQGILHHAADPIRELRDLDGRTIMAGAGSVWIQFAQKKYGITLNLLPLGGGLARFMNDPRFLQQCFVTNEPFFARQGGAEVGARLIAQPGYEPYRVMLGSREFVARHPEVVRAFVRASVRGWVDYLTGDPAPADARLRQLRPDLSPEFLAYSRQAMLDYQLVLGDPARGERMGLLTTERLETQLRLLRELGLLDRELTVDDVATLEFLPPAP